MPSFLPDTSEIALKEWAVAVKTLMEGRMVLILRKGGIHQHDEEYRITHPEFMLLPTYDPQKAELLKTAFHHDLSETMQQDDISGLVEIAAWAEITNKFEVREQEVLDLLSPHHIWTSDYALKELYWKPNQPLTIALLRIYRLKQPQALPLLDEYKRSKSWVELVEQIPLGHLEPVLSDEEYESMTDTISKILAGG